MDRLLRVLKSTILITTIIAITTAIISYFIEFKELDKYILTACMILLLVLTRRYSIKHCDKLAAAGIILSIISLI